MKFLQFVYFRFILTVALGFFLFKYIGELYYGQIKYASAFEIKYSDAPAGKVIMESGWYKMETDRTWLDFTYQSGCLGRGGYFISTKGVIEYEYGIFAPDYVIINEDISFNIREDTVMNTAIRLIENEKEFGIYVHLNNQKGMSWPLIIYPSGTGKKIKKELIDMISTMKFKGMTPKMPFIQSEPAGS